MIVYRKERKRRKKVKDLLSDWSNCLPNWLELITDIIILYLKSSSYTDERNWLKQYNQSSHLTHWSSTHNHGVGTHKPKHPALTRNPTHGAACRIQGKLGKTAKYISSTLAKILRISSILAERKASHYRDRCGWSYSSTLVLSG